MQNKFRSSSVSARAETTDRARHHWHWLVFLLGLALTLGLFWQNHRQAAADLQGTFRRLAVNRTQLIQRELGVNLSDLEDTRRFCEMLGEPSRAQFQEFTAALAQRSGFQALEWAPRVRAGQRATFEAAARDEVSPHFQILERGPAGNLQPATGREEYFPIRFATPLEGNEGALGFDLGSEPVRRQAMELARDSGTPVVSERTHLVLDSPDQPGLLIFVPVFTSAQPHATVAERRTHLRGFVIGAFRASSMLEHALASSLPRGLAMQLSDPSGPPGSQLLYERRPELAAGDGSDLVTAPPLRNLRLETNFPFAGREWRFVVQANRRFVELESGGFAWLILAAGLALSLVLALYLRDLATARQRAELLAGERTADLRASEANLAASQQRLATIIATEPECVKLVAADGTLLEMNRAGLAMVEAEDAGQVVGNSMLDLLAPEWRAAFTRLNERVFQGETVVLEFEIVGRKGTRRWVETHAAPLRDPDGRISAQLAVTRDVTQRKVSEARIRESEERYRRLAENIADVVWLYDFKENRFVYVSPSVEQRSGFTVAEFLRQPMLEALTPESRELVLARTPQRLAAFAAGDESCRTEVIELQERRRDGSIVCAEVVTTLITDASRQVTHLQGVSRDITERKQAETRLHSQRELALALASTVNLPTGLELCVRAAIQAAQFDCGGFYLIDEVTGAIELPTHTGLSPEFVAAVAHYPADSDHVRLILSGQAVYSRLDALRLEMAAAVQQEGLRFLAVVPVCREGRVIGCLNIASHTKQELPAPERLALETIAAIAGATLARLRAEAALQRSEALNRSLVEHLPQRVFIKDRASCYVSCNPSYARDLGIKPEQIVGKNDYDFFPAGLADQYRADDQQVMAGGQPKDFEEQYQIAGQELWIHTIKVPYRDTGGRVVGVVGIFEDFTERKRMQVRTDAFRELGRVLNEAKDSSQASHAIKETASRIWHWDALFLLRYEGRTDTVTELVNLDTLDGKRVAVPVAPAGAKPTPLVREVFATGPRLILRPVATGSSDTTIRFGDKSRASNSLMFVPIRFEGANIGILSVQSYQPHAFTAEDLRTLLLLADHGAGALVRVEAEAELRASEQRFGTIFRASPVGVCLVRLADDRIVDLNEALVRIYGYSRDEALGRTARELNVWVDLEQRGRFVQHVLAQGRVQDVQLSFRRKNGEIGELIGAAEAVELGGERCLLIFVRDVTAFNRTQAVLRHAQKMESIGHLAGGVAHHFNNILAALTLNLSMLRDQVRDPELDISLKLLLDLTRDAGGLVEQLLAYGRKSMLQIKPCNLDALVHEICRLLVPLLGERIHLEYSPRGPGAWIEADRALIQQAIMNLCLNARDAMPEGGQLRIDLAEIEVPGEVSALHPLARPGRFAQLTVSDTGHGMGDATLQHLFEPFFTTKEVGRGTGLGLATAAGIAEQHHGWIEVESAPGRGAKFRVLLPAVPPPAIRQPALPNALQPDQARVILLVEDDATVRRAFSAFLRAKAHRVLEAANGSAAREIWAQHQPEIDLLLTDVVMPGGENGWQLAGQLRGEKPSLKVILCSGYSYDTIASRLKPDDQFVWLAKPFSPEELTAALTECFPGGEAEPPIDHPASDNQPSRPGA